MKKKEMYNLNHTLVKTMCILNTCSDEREMIERKRTPEAAKNTSFNKFHELRSKSTNSLKNQNQM